MEQGSRGYCSGDGDTPLWLNSNLCRGAVLLHEGVEVEVFLQPVYQSSTQRMVAAEALSIPSAVMV